MQPQPQVPVIAGKYRLVRQLGKGGMGSVWYAEHLTLHSPVAIKLIEPEIATNPEALARFLREAQAAASLRSPHVVQILDHGVDNGVPYIAMEVLDGESLADRLTRVGRLSPAETARLITHVGRAIGRAHEAGIVHRDLKPDNVFIIRNDEEEIGKVLDFGIAKSSMHGLGASAGGATRTGALLGTPYYMSPEQAEGARGLDHRTDIWAMGVIAFECIVGRRPFDAEALGGLLLAICTRPIPIPSQLAPVPPGFDGWFARACARELDQRFPTAKEAATELRRVCDGTAGSGAQHMQSHPGLNTGGAVFANSAGPSGSGRSVPGFAATTGQLSNSELALMAPKKSRAPLVLLVVGLGAVAVGAAVVFMRISSSDANATSSAELPSAAVPAAPVEVPRVEPVVAPAAPEVLPPPAPSADAPKSAPAPAARAPVLPRKGPAPKAPPKPAEPPKPAAAAPPPPAPAPAAPVKPKVNLGI